MSPKIYPIQSLTPGPNGHIAIKGPIGPWNNDVVAIVITVVVSQVIVGANGDPEIATAIGWSIQYTAVGDWSANTPAVGANPLQPGEPWWPPGPPSRRPTAVMRCTSGRCQ